MNKVIVTLRRRFARWPGFVLVGVNQRGQLPAVLVDPVDCAGRIIHGVWLGDSVDDGCDGTTQQSEMGEVEALTRSGSAVRLAAAAPTSALRCAKLVYLKLLSSKMNFTGA